MQEKIRKGDRTVDETVTKGITYEDLNELSSRVYAWLKQKGIGKEDFV